MSSLHHRTKHHPIVSLAFEGPSGAESSFVSFYFHSCQCRCPIKLIHLHFRWTRETTLANQRVEKIRSKVALSPSFLNESTFIYLPVYLTDRAKRSPLQIRGQNASNLTPERPLLGTDGDVTPKTATTQRAEKTAPECSALSPLCPLWCRILREEEAGDVKSQRWWMTSSQPSSPDMTGQLTYELSECYPTLPNPYVGILPGLSFFVEDLQTL